MMIPMNITDPIFKKYNNIIKEKKQVDFPKRKGGPWIMSRYNHSFEMAKMAKHWRKTDSE